VSYTLNPIAVRLDRVIRKLGSGDAALAAELAAEFADEAEELDEMAAEAAEDRGIPPLTLSGAFEHLIVGGERQQKLGFVYGYAFAYLCQHLGDWLDNTLWSGVAGSNRYMERIDAELGRLGIDRKTLSTVALTARGAPVELPRIDDFPSLSHLRLPEVTQAGAALAAVDLASVSDAEVRDAIAEVKRWFDECVAARADFFAYYC